MRLLLRSLVFALIGVALFATWRTRALRSRQLPADERAALAAEPFDLRFDPALAAERLARVVRVPTLSPDPLAPATLEPFERVHALLRELYPRTFETLEVEIVGGGSLLLRWPGRDASLAPLLAMAHLDVVPAGGEENWTHPPFAGVVTDGRVFGRGTLDDKGAVCAWLEAVELLLTAGEAPARTVYFAFGQDEEIGGARGNGAIARALAERGVRLALVLDEGGFSTQGVVALVEGPLVLVGVAEKGYLTARLSVRAAGGHSSIPANPTAIERLARAITRLEAEAFPARIDGATGGFLEWIAPELALGPRVALANLWLSERWVSASFLGAARTAALLRTTVATTVIEGGERENVLPTDAFAEVNLRLLPGDGLEWTLAHLRAVIDDPLVEIEARPGAREASGVSSTGSEGFRAVQRAIARIEPDALVAPYLLVGGTDARHYEGIAETVLRIQPYRLTPETIGRFHGPDEFVSIERHAKVVRFDVALLRDFAGVARH